MTTVGTAALEPELSQRQGHIVGDDQQPFLVDILLVKPVAHGIAAEIHEGGGLQQEHLPPTYRRLGHETIAAVVEDGTGGLGKGIENHKSCVVARSGVLAAGIA